MNKNQPSVQMLASGTPIHTDRLHSKTTYSYSGGWKHINLPKTSDQIFSRWKSFSYILHIWHSKAELGSLIRNDQIYNGIVTAHAFVIIPFSSNYTWPWTRKKKLFENSSQFMT
jgi:hypothetical protein